ncbi:serine/threonine protein kinase [Candidatus Oscillochloris fontis]|uniref:serine/threonine protein kinase n=1 Tax=Candidatus Oscillochloris fontis TaxID=2496868 RepID=UPI00101C2015|nr:serine/threonine-protein kinase [Candidatus Oscillochloris fontis]
MKIPAQIGHYILDNPIGDGGSSVVWLAHHAVLTEHKVAFKFLRDRNSENIRRFEREATIALRLHHPNIIKTYDYGQSEDLYYTISEYIPGSSLAQLIEQQGPIPFETALHIFRQVAAGLDYAHKQKIIHRDIAPKNILIEAASQRVILIDFGIAREHNPAHTETGSFMGTLGFLSPEHFPNGQPISHLSDIFALGIVLYYMLSAKLPWEESLDNPPKATFSAPIPLHQRNIPHLPGSVDRVLLTMLALDPARRYPSLQAAVEELDRLIARHHVATQVVGHSSTTTAPTTPAFQAHGLEPSQIESILGTAVAQVVLDKVRQHADELSNPQELTHLLNQWAAQYPWALRRPLLGRLAKFHQATTKLIAFYYLRVLYEQRTAPQLQERPDHKAEHFPVESEVDYWKIELPQGTDFRDEPGSRLTIPGSIQILKCPACQGAGVSVCPRCKGSRRVMVTRPVVASLAPVASATAAATSSSTQRPPRSSSGSAAAKTPPPPAASPPAMEQVLEPCPDCSGRGGLPCSRCQGARRLIQEKTFSWSRQTTLFTAHDGLHKINPHLLLRTCPAEEIYRERYPAGFNPLWNQLEGVAPLTTQAQRRLSNDTRMVLSELRIHVVPVTEIVFDLGKSGEDDLYCLYIYGFEKFIPNDNRFFNWERLVAIGALSMAFLTLLLMALLRF